MSLIAEADFGLSLLRESAINQTTVLSPISVALALSLVHLGAKGTSREQIKNALCKGTSHEDCVKHFSTLQQKVIDRDHPYLKNWIYCTKPGNISCVPEDMREFYKTKPVPADYPLRATSVLMNVANRICASNDIVIKKAYQDELLTKFNASLQNLDYKNPEKAAEIVNSFVKNETTGKIDKLVGADSFEDGKLALLVNAVYFHGRWSKSFGEHRNKKEQFFVKEVESKELLFMKHSEEPFPLLNTEDFTALSLPYRNRKYRLTIALPKKRFGLFDALEKLNGEKLKELISGDEIFTVNVALPKFKIETETQLQDVLKKIGVADPFNDNADLSGITDVPLKLGRVKHKVMIDVNEKGTTASAATAVEATMRSGKHILNDPIDFVADHPFLFVLSYEGHILFTGQYYG